jgi:flagellar assembly factor FliW
MKAGTKLKEKLNPQMELDSPKYGKIVYTEKDIIYMASPLLGFNHLSDYILITSEEHLPFYIYHSVEEPSVSFIVVDIKMFFPDYNPVLHKRELKVLQVKSADELKFFGIIVVPSNPKEATINLKGPLAINLEKKLAKQVILEDDAYDIKTPLFKD